MSSFKLARRTQSGLKKLNYVPVQTTLVTDQGPKEGTIWFDRERSHAPPFVVKYVDAGMVRYVDGNGDYLSGFIKCAKEGRYILVGMTWPDNAHLVV